MRVRWIEHRSFKVLIVLAGLAAVLCYLSHYFLAGQDAIVYAHDNLDSYVAYYKSLGENHQLMIFRGSALIDQVMHGLYRSCFNSPLNLITVLYRVFNFVTAYILNEILIHLIAFLGMYLFLAKHIMHSRHISNQIISVCLAALFALLPFWSNAGISIAGQPLLFFALFNLKNGESRATDWLIILFFVFYSSLALSGIFIVFMWVVMVGREVILKGRIEFRFLLGLAVLIILYSIAEFQLVTNMISPYFVSHRTEFVPSSLDFHDSLKFSTDILAYGQYHAHSLHTFYIMPVILILMFILLLPENYRGTVIIVGIGLFSLLALIHIIGILDWETFFKDKVLKQHPVALLGLLLAFIILLFYRGHTKPGLILLTIIAICLFYGFWGSELLYPVKLRFSILKQFQFDRFYFLLPFLWIGLLAVLLKTIRSYSPVLVIAFFVILLSQGVYSFRMIDGESYRNPQPLRAFYKEGLYDEIASFIHRPKSDYRVINIGLDPAKAIFNGFYTLDGYVASYPLEYKHRFREIISGELAKNERNRDYFDGWGNRCYFFVSGTDRDTIDNLSMNVEAFKRLGGQYIFSEYEIRNADHLNLILLKVFQTDQADGSVFLYAAD